MIFEAIVRRIHRDVDPDDAEQVALLRAEVAKPQGAVEVISYQRRGSSLVEHRWLRIWAPEVDVKVIEVWCQHEDVVQWLALSSSPRDGQLTAWLSNGDQVRFDGRFAAGCWEAMVALLAFLDGGRLSDELEWVAC
ncbi:MAG: hypothetical protein KTR31_02615 [Myxococcales bacterium]|nr:hypothetical protein [Myxococcales bacterium]